MLKESEIIGLIVFVRQEVRPFNDKQITLLQNFASQAVIAIENTRLLNELRQRTDELGRSVGELRALGEVSQAVNSTLDLETVLSTIVAKAVQLSSTEAGAIYVFDELRREFHLRATYGMDQEQIEALAQQHIGLDEPNITPDFLEGEPIQVPDLREGVSSAANEIVRRAGFRARLVTPLLCGEEIVGMLVVRRRTRAGSDRSANRLAPAHPHAGAHQRSALLGGNRRRAAAAVRRSARAPAGKELAWGVARPALTHPRPLVRSSVGGWEGAG
jgi:GAF domain-containing protein